MNSNSQLRIFSLEVSTEINSITPHVRYIAPDNVLKDLYRILNCELVTCTEIEVNGKFFDVWSDDEALLKEKAVPNLFIDDVHLLWDFSLKQFPKLLAFIARQRRNL